MENPTKFEEIVKREVCRITSKGTKDFSLIVAGDGSTPHSAYLLSICEKPKVWNIFKVNFDLTEQRFDVFEFLVTLRGQIELDYILEAV